MDNQDLEDLIADAISDSLEMDWTSRDGARAVVAALYAEGLLPLTAEDQLKINAAWEIHKAAAPSTIIQRDPGPHCTYPPEGWFCTRDAGHDGPCAAREVEQMCPSSPWRIHVIDTSMESGPHNCFHCGARM